MGWFPFKLHAPKRQKSPVLIFRDGESYFQYCCQYMDTRIIANRGLVALVLDGRQEFGTANAVAVKDRGIQTAVIKVSSSDGGFRVIADTLSGTGDRLQPGDLVAWTPVEYLATFGNVFEDGRAAWSGFIVAKLAPEFDSEIMQIKAISRY